NIAEARGTLTPSHNLHVCHFPDTQFDVLDLFLEQLVSSTPPTATALAAPIDSLFVARSLVRVDNVDDPHIAALLGRADIIGEDDLITRPRAVVVGPAGSGKSYLLDRLSRGGHGSTQFVLVPARALPEPVGSVRALIGQWLSAGRVYEEFTLDAVIDGTLPIHLLIDGLDELVPSARGAVVDALTRIGREMPHIRLTVTSRPAAALAKFDIEWQSFELLCDSAWRQEFLAKADVTEEALAARLGPSADRLSSLLTIPFYLRRLATSTSAALDQALSAGDVLGILLAVLDEQVNGDAALQAVSSGVRSWLTKVALVMQLSGQRELLFNTLTPLAAGLGLGDVELVAQRLAARSLLQDPADTWSFEHRLFSDALIADRVLENSPSAWIDLIAPTVRGRSAVREDWREVTGLVGARSRQWRAEISARDLVVGARITPATAGIDERITAMTTLWEHSARRQVWLEGDARGPNDGDHIIRLAPDPFPQPLHSIVVGALTTGTRYDRSNALSLLVRIDKDPETLLRHALATEADSTLRRSAASWATRLNLTNLRDDVLARALQPADDAEASDMAAIALELSPRADKLRVGHELRAAGNQNVHDFYLFDDNQVLEQIHWRLGEARMSPEDTIYRGDRKLAELLVELPQSTTITDEDAAAVAELAAYSGAPTARAIISWVSERPLACAAGLVRALESDDVHIHDIINLAVAIGAGALASAGAPNNIVEMIKIQEQARAAFEAAVPTDLEGDAEAVTAFVPPASASDTLNQLLGMPTDDALELLLRRERPLVQALRESDPVTKQRMRLLLADLWAGKDLTSAVTAVGDGREVTIARWALAVLAFGHAADFALTDERWISVAVCGWSTEPLRVWLASTATPDRLSNAARDAPVAAWTFRDVARIATPARVPDIEVRVHELDDAQLDTAEGHELLHALAASGAEGALRAAAKRSEALANYTEPLLAAAGDVPSQRAQLHRLRERLAAGQVVDRHEAPWLDAVSDPQLADDVLDAFIAGGQTNRGSTPFDVTSVLLTVSCRIGGDQTLARLEAVASEPAWEGAQWLFRNVDEMLQRELTLAAELPSHARLANLGLPTPSAPAPL
ncbi:MAG: hypothetical protein JWM31_837, partial [Solirubrobacterales bacterium]|nr:hypothetical protein [Solirubrobacterales bacterium]